MPEVVSQTFDLVGREVNASLGEARAALEAYVEQPDNLQLLEKCSQELHQVHGVLRMLEIYGAALLTEEMEHVAQYLIATHAERKSQAESLDALMRAMVQLPGYLERVLAGGRDLALVLLPLLNDLRAVRGSALLSEGTLLLLNLKSDRQAQPAAPAPGEPPLTVAQWARRLRSRFQVGLVGWIRGERLEQNLEILATVATRLEQVATQQSVFQLWWVVGALLEALREVGLEGGVSVKRLLGLADREIRRLYEQGESRYAQAPPVELLNNLLYYVARSSTSGPRVTAVRASFRLNELLPVDEAIEQERESLSAPSVKLMHTVAAAIREDLSKVKDVLDIYVRRGGGGQTSELSPQLEMLRKIGDTLGVLGLGELRGRVQEAATRLEAMVAGRERADDAALIQVAATLIKVEDHLDDQLVGLILPRAVIAPDGEEPPPDEDFAQVQAAVLRECVVNLARIKEAVAQNVGGTLDASGFDSWPDLMRGIKAGLLMLGKARAVEVVDGVMRHLRRVMQPGGVALPTDYLDRLADAIVSLEYYIETLQSGRSDPWYMLDNAQSCLATLDHEPERAVPTVPTVSPAATGVYARTVLLDKPRGEPQLVDSLENTDRRLTTPPVVPVANRQPPAQQTPADPELQQLFIEEAREEVANIQRYFPAWDQNPLEGEALLRVRRSFHTLKGSGRMVGVRELAEFSWAIENLLNRLLDGTQQRSQPILELLREAVGKLPTLVAELADGHAGVTDVNGLVARAHAFAAGREPETAYAATQVIAREPAPPYVPTITQQVVDVGTMSFTAQQPVLPPLPPAAAEPPAPPSQAGKPAPPPSPAASGPETSDAQAPFPEPPVAPPAHTQEFPFPELLLDPEPLPELTPQPEPMDAWHAPPPATAAAADEPDSALREIYARETQSHVATVRTWLAQTRAHNAPHVLPEVVYRACHTLSGSSKMAEARHGIRLAEPLNQWLRKSFDSGIGLDDSDLELLADCMSAMETVAGHLDERTGYFVVHDTLRGRIARAESALEHRIAEASASHQISAAPLSAPPLGASPVATSPDYDPDIAAIFCEEASELLEASEAALADWNAAPEDGARVAALKRPLHTLKGGARMAGIVAMGDLAHELETLVTQIETGLAQGDTRARAVAQQSIDELARMRDSIAAGRPVNAATEQIARIREVSRGHEATLASVLPEMVLTPPLQPAATTPPAANQAAPPDQPPVLEQPPVPEQPPAINPPPAAADAALQAPDHEPYQPTVTDTQVPVGATAAPAMPAPAPVPPGREPVVNAERTEMARVSAELLDQLLNNAGEVSIARARLDQQLGAIEGNNAELSRTVIRLKEQLRKLELETEAQILNRHEEGPEHRNDFDPLELDRYSSLQQFSRALAESASDVGSLQQALEAQITEAQALLLQQARTVTELQNDLMRTRMVSLQRHVQRLARIVRQAASDYGKQAELVVEGASGELDRQVLERMLPPFEHLLRNAVVHGIEAPAQRLARGKPEAGQIKLALRREGAEVIIDLTDDGSGMDLRAIRAKGIKLGLIGPEQHISDEDIMQLVLEPGFSTADTLTQHAGRGVGMDVVATEIKKLGGALHMESHYGQGTRFTIKLPVTLAISHALIARVGDEYYALPLPTVEGVVRLPRNDVARQLQNDVASFIYGGQKYRLQPLASYVGMEPAPLPEADVTIPVVLVRAGDHSTGLVLDELLGSREIVVKPVGPQISGIRGISGATLLGDGRVVVILDIGALVRAEWRGRTLPVVPRQRHDERVCALVVDDSITVRKVTQRLLERNGMRVLTARDGRDAVVLMQEETPDILLLDIEMPRMDGYEVAAHVRGDPRLRDIPIIMITSRVGEKHRARAIELGVDDYLGKPYQESQLLDAIAPLVARRRAAREARQ
ncbi:MAG TPA: Hpt domain-containing protein [Steroidobacteraceae bacterium]|nr:Hpt domain-containing protein [Steroidobacteraceae bacterium]